ncbi:hypothetical protein OIU80_11325 [Flavobacterium sp. LS1R47]|uniref:Uncharacterized protein n=1 Tax=Flavobacterium frigoritolerans TaxID=2987686 RepID=A0A9X3C1S5_9FLAO|nr:hypothetical protein [Flavobacterium frigoritolerans]MCV9932876.1 hypothetical protein [Flavobacterium frigoritolerans]
MDLINENIIKTVLTVSGTVLAAILGKQSLSNLFDSLQRRNLKNVLNDLETFSALDKFDEDFKTKFIEPHVKELYFFSQTGIDTNEKSIPKYISFKDKLGGNYTWPKIKRAKQHLDSNGPEIKINLSKTERICANIAISLSLFFFTGGIILYFYLNQFKTQGIGDILITMGSLVVPMIIGFLFFISVDSILIAKQMEKRLKSL